MGDLWFLNELLSLNICHGRFSFVFEVLVVFAISLLRGSARYNLQEVTGRKELMIIVT